MKSVARITLINLALLVIGVAAAELAFGSWIFGPDYGLLNIPRDERRVFDVSSLYPGGGKITYTRDSFGFRGNAERAPAEIDVVVLGGSTTNERYIDDAATWVARLQESFRRSGVSLAIVNASVDGQTSIGHVSAVELWLKKIPDFRPSHALVYIGINDVVVDEAQMHQFDLMMSPEPSRRFRQYIMNHSALYNLFRTIRGSWAAREAHLVHGDTRASQGGWRRVETPADVNSLRTALVTRLSSYEARLRALASTLQSMGAQPIFVTQKSGNHKTVDGVSYVLRRTVPPESIDVQAKTLALFNEVTLATCRKLSLVCVDLAGRIEFADGDFYDAIHTTPSGSAKVADFLYTELKDVLKPRR